MDSGWALAYVSALIAKKGWKGFEDLSHDGTVEGLDVGWVCEHVDELIHERGREILEHYWDSGGPDAGAGSEGLYLFDGLYFVRNSDTGFDGPHKKLDEALDQGALLWVTEATEWIRWDESILPTPELIAKIEVHGTPPSGRITVNGKVLPIVDGRIGRADEA